MRNMSEEAKDATCKQSVRASGHRLGAVCLLRELSNGAAHADGGVVAALLLLQQLLQLELLQHLLRLRVLHAPPTPPTTTSHQPHARGRRQAWKHVRSAAKPAAPHQRQWRTSARVCAAFSPASFTANRSSYSVSVYSTHLPGRGRRQHRCSSAQSRAARTTALVLAVRRLAEMLVLLHRDVFPADVACDSAAAASHLVAALSLEKPSVALGTHLWQPNASTNVPCSTTTAATTAAVAPPSHRIATHPHAGFRHFLLHTCARVGLLLVLHLSAAQRDVGLSLL